MMTLLQEAKKFWGRTPKNVPKGVQSIAVGKDTKETVQPQSVVDNSGNRKME
jgi:hypothetical protein